MLQPVPAGPCPDHLCVDTATFAGVRTRTIRGTGDSPRFLFLHGFSDTADGWRRVQCRLADAGHGSMAVDQPSHGAADPLDAERPVVDQFVEFAAEAAYATDGGRPVIVVGNSLGGAHALALAQRHPELVEGVVAISPASFDHPVWFKLLGIVPADVRPPALVARTVAGPGMRLMGFGRPWRVPRGFLAEWTDRFVGDGDHLRALAARVPEEYLRTSPVDLGEIRVPVQVIWGNRDHVTSISSRRRFEDQVADLEFVTLPGVGHLPQLEVPGRTTKHLLRFAARLGHEVPLAPTAA